MRLVRSVVAVVAGLLLVSLIAEAIEFAVVSLVHGGPTTNQEVFLSVRNTPPVLTAKLIYNTLAGVAGGYVTGRLAPRAPLGHAIALALVQTLAFVWAMTNPELRPTMPDPFWLAVTAVTVTGIVIGALVQARTFARKVVQ